MDVRIVYVPPKSLGNFGGDTDNFEWPRHTADFALLRAYVGADGAPAPYAADNVPYTPRVALDKGDTVIFGQKVTAMAAILVHKSRRNDSQ